MKRRLTTKALKNKLDRMFKAMVRQRDDGLGCISCGQPKTLQAGHFVPCGKALSTRWHPWNVNGECEYDNGFNPMHLLGYSNNFDHKWGQGAMEKVLKLSLVRWKPQREQLERLILACDSPEDYEEEWFLIQKEFAPEEQ